MTCARPDPWWTAGARRARKRDRSGAHANLPHFRAVFETLRAGLFQIDHRNGFSVLVTDKQKSVVGSHVDIDATGKIRIANIAENWVATTGGHPHHIQKKNVIIMGHD